jgi:hypothetical protein
MWCFIATLLCISLVSIAILYLFVKDAPEGYEDDNGFHYGRPEDDKEER